MKSELFSILFDVEKLIGGFTYLDSYEALIENIKTQIDIVAENDTTGLYLFSKEENKLKLFYAKGFSEQEKKEAELTAMERHPGHVYTTGNILLVTDQDQEHNPFSIDSKKKSHTRSRMYVPVKAKNLIIGAFGIQSEKPNAFTERHLAVFQVFAALAGNAYFSIENKIENEKLSILARSTTNNVIYTDKDGKITWVNKHFEESTGYFLDEIIGKTPGSFLIGKDTDPEKTHELRTAILNKKACDTTMLNYKKNGEPFIVNIKLIPIFNDTGELVNFVSIQEDITETEKQKAIIIQKNDQLKLREEQYNRIVNTTNDFIISLDAGGQIKFANKSWLEKMNYQIDEVIETNIFNYIHPDSQAHCMLIFNNINKTENKSFLIQYNLINKDKVKIEVEGEVIVTYKDDGIYSINSYLKDVTEINKLRIEKENKIVELKESKDRLEIVLGSLSESVWGVSLPDYNLEYISESAVSIYGYPLQAWYDNANLWSDAIHPEDKEFVLKASEKLFDVGQFISEYRIITADKKEKYIHSETKIITNEKGIPILMTGITRDITTKKTAERELLNYKNALDRSAIVSITDVKGNITYVNEKFCEISKYSKEELIGENHRKINSGFHPPEFFQDMWKTILGGNIWNGEIQNKAKDGSIYYVQSSIIPFMKDGKPYQFVAIRYESTEKVLAKLAIDDQKQFYETILNNIPGNVAVFDIKGNYIFVNPNTVKDPVLREWLIGKNNYDYCNYRGLSMDLAIERDKQFQLLLENGKSISSVEKRQTKEGQTAYTNSNLILHEYKGEKLMIAYAIDITELKNAEAKVSELKLFYENILNNIPIDIAVFDNKHRYLFLNKEAVKNDEIRTWLIGKDDFDYARLKGIATDNAQLRRNQFNYVMKTDSRAFWLDEQVNSSGETKYKERRLHSYDNKKFIVGYAVDVTEVKTMALALEDNMVEMTKYNTLLKSQNEDLNRVNMELDKFVYSTSHDLRAPLKSIMGLINISKESTDTDNNGMNERLEMINKSVQKLDNFIEDILQYYRNSRMEAERDEINYEEMIQEIRNNLKFMEGTKNLNLQVEIHKGETFFSDKRRISVILNNLVSNAIKYSDVSKENMFVNIFVECSKENATITIEDNGIGIADKDKEKIFKMFYRATKLSTGSGLGLYIVKESLDKLGGTITLESELTKGTKFIVEIPNLLTSLN